MANVNPSGSARNKSDEKKSSATGSKTASAHNSQDSAGSNPKPKPAKKFKSFFFSSRRRKSARPILNNSECPDSDNEPVAGELKPVQPSQSRKKSPANAEDHSKRKKNKSSASKHSDSKRLYKSTKSRRKTQKMEERRRRNGELSLRPVGKNSAGKPSSAQPGEKIKNFPFIQMLTREGAEHSKTLEKSYEKKEQPSSSTLQDDVVKVNHHVPHGKAKEAARTPRDKSRDKDPHDRDVKDSHVHKEKDKVHKEKETAKGKGSNRKDLYVEATGGRESQPSSSPNTSNHTSTPVPSSPAPPTNVAPPLVSPCALGTTSVELPIPAKKDKKKKHEKEEDTDNAPTVFESIDAPVRPLHDAMPIRKIDTTKELPKVGTGKAELVIDETPTAYEKKKPKDNSNSTRSTYLPYYAAYRK